MARDDGPPGVEFDVHGDDDAPDEELAQPSQATRANPRWTLAGGAVVLVAAALIARGVNHHDKQGVVPSASATPSVSLRPPGLIAPESNRPIPDGRGLPFAAPLCQPPAGCSLVTRLPGPTFDALDQTFPGITVRASSTVLATRADKMAPDVVTRTISARVGDASIAVRMRMAVPIDSRDFAEHREGDVTTTSLTELSLGYAITITVTRPGVPVPVIALEKLATDGRLILPD